MMPSFTVFKGSEGGQIVEAKTQRPDLGPNQVLVRITHSGLCGTDVHYKGTDMGLGHEGVGIVEEVGNAVTQFQKGDRAGWGYNHDCCGHCKECLSGYDIYCPERAMYGYDSLDQGSMGSHAVWKESFLFRIPDSLPSEIAAPLQCGGITVYAALQSQYPVKVGERVGVVGIGGLGHLAIQFAAKMGCEVVVFSGTDSKREQAMELGAREFYAMKGVTDPELKDNRGIDRLIVTTSSIPDYSVYMKVMNPRGAIYPLGVDEGNLEVPNMPFLVNGIRIQGGVVGSRQIHREMLQFAAISGVKPIIQQFPMTKQGIEEAFKTLEDGKMRYRGVLVAQ